MGFLLPSYKEDGRRLKTEIHAGSSEVQGRPWVWTAVDPVSKLLFAIEVGPRTVEMAQCVVHRVKSVLAARLSAGLVQRRLQGVSPCHRGPLWQVD